MEERLTRVEDRAFCGRSQWRSATPAVRGRRVEGDERGDHGAPVREADRGDRHPFGGVWCLGVYGREDGVASLIAAVAAFALSIGLVVYDSWFLRKTRTLR